MSFQDISSLWFPGLKTPSLPFKVPLTVILGALSVAGIFVTGTDVPSSFTMIFTFCTPSVSPVIYSKGIALPNSTLLGG